MISQTILDAPDLRIMGHHKIKISIADLKRVASNCDTFTVAVGIIIYDADLLDDGLLISVHNAAGSLAYLRQQGAEMCGFMRV